jgi:hypothetical protein
MVLSYALATVAIRACAEAQYITTMVFDAAHAAASFFLIQRVAEAKTFGDRFAYILGGALGAAAGIKLSLLLG